MFDNCVIYGGYLDEIHTFLLEGEYRILCRNTFMVLCWSSPSCTSHETMMPARGYLYLKVLNYEVPLVMSPVIQATGRRIVNNWGLAPTVKMLIVGNTGHLDNEIG